MAGTETMQTTYSGEITYPDRWHDGFITHPPGSLRFDGGRLLDSWTPEQWAAAFDTLKRGFAIAVVAHEEEPGDVIEDVVWRSPFRLRAFHDVDSDTVYFCRDESAARAKRTGKGKRKSK